METSIKISIIVSTTILLLFVSLFSFIVIRGNNSRNKIDSCISKGNKPIECNCAYTMCDSYSLIYLGIKN